MALLQKPIRSLVLYSAKQFLIYVIFEKEVIWCKSVTKIFTICQCIKAVVNKDFQILLSFNTYKPFLAHSFVSYDTNNEYRVAESCWP